AKRISAQDAQLKVTFLGGLDEVGEKNMAILEWADEAIVLDCGNSLGVDLPGVNYEINDPTYLQSIQHKLKGYVVTHGHLDHIGGLRHIVPLCPAPIYGSRFSIGLIERSFEDAKESGLDFTPQLVIADIDDHEPHAVGTSTAFSVEFIRVTHSLPDAAAICVTTPVGKVVATGDFRLDPEPLDKLPTDTSRLKALGDEGVLLLLSESSYADSEGRTPTESTLQQSFYDVIDNATGRIFVAVFSSNMNRTQMIINAAAAAGRKIALDGRSMLGFAEIAVRQGILKVPKGMMIPMHEAANVPDNQLLVMCTGGQGEPRAALQRMSEGEHKYIKLRAGDTVVISSSPIPGNEIRYDAISNNLANMGVHLFRHPTHELDGCGPLHVSGHARRDELREMIHMLRPQFFVPVHGGALRRRYHADLAVQEHIPRSNVGLPNNGDVLLFTTDTMRIGGTVPYGSLLVDQNGHVVSNVVIRDRLLLSEEGILTVTLTVDAQSGALLTSPDIVSRGFIHLQANPDFLNDLRNELRRAVKQRFTRIDADRFKQELREHVTHFVYEHTGRSPIIIPVLNIIASKVSARSSHAAPSKTTVQLAAADQQRFQEMRARLLGQDQTD
ncbi:MAG TPA: ribonuclease J, partial [Candidatus Saccharimonadales bacterium]|nr:ribonuclease J [Candidatus Saccharimonadales bacterium]